MGKVVRKKNRKKKEQLSLANMLSKLGGIVGKVMGKKDNEKEEQLILANILSKIVLSSSDITEIGKEFAYELKEFMSIDWAAIGLIEESRGLVSLFPLSPKLNSDWEHGNSIPLDGTPFSWLRQNKRALVEPDLAEKSQFWSGSSWLKSGVRTIAYMPLFSGGEVFGGLVFASHHPQAYGDREMKLLKYATSQITAPIRYSSLLAPIIEESQQIDQQSDEKILMMERLLNDYASVIEDHIQHLQGFTGAIQSFDEVVQEQKELVMALDQFAESLEKTIPEKKEIVPSIETVKYPPGCIRNRSLAQQEKIVEVR